jgi:hypothetical protein
MRFTCAIMRMTELLASDLDLLLENLLAIE